jgi:hypothetical protein
MTKNICEEAISSPGYAIGDDLERKTERLRQVIDRFVVLRK